MVHPTFKFSVCLHGLGLRYSKWGFENLTSNARANCPEVFIISVLWYAKVHTTTERGINKDVVSLWTGVI